MEQKNTAEPTSDVLQTETWSKDVLGYLNFSSGNREIRFFQSLDSLFQHCSSTKGGNPTAIKVVDVLKKELTKLSADSKVFRVDDQAGLILKLVEEHFFTAYRTFHQDLLFHQNGDQIFNSFFLAKVFEAVLQEGSPWTDTERIISAVMTELNDYIGYRPVPVLEGKMEKHQPHKHEWSAPIPLYIQGIGTATGRYKDVIDQALTIIRHTKASLLREACFDIDRMQELVMDARAYDFDHPVNRKPNYHFGIWDPNEIDNEGFYKRFVVHQVTLDGILSRLEDARLGEGEIADVPYDELIYEAGAVLAGTMLMGSGVCGDTPGTYTSETSLAELMPIIANYRDVFYEGLLVKMPEKMKPRIQKEQVRLFQPFGGCRQALNRQMAKRRADQLQRMHLARLYARLGYPEAAMKQTEVIAVASARILTLIDCHTTSAHLLADNDKLGEAAAQLPIIEDLIRRGISCGAIVDPWTMLGFGGAFTLFVNADNAIHDHRIDDLINLLEEIFDLYSRLEKEAAAAGNSDLQSDLSDKMSDLASWWDRFGSSEVESLDSFSGYETWESAAVVSTALAAWHAATLQGSAAAGDVAFWQRHVNRFKSTKAFVHLAEALLDQQDPVASMALLMHWLSHSEDIPLVEGDYSFHAIVLRWMEQLWNDETEKSAARKDGRPVTVPLRRKPTKKAVVPLPFEERWKLTQKFFDFLEANADEYWEVPTLELDDTWFDNKSGTKKPDSRKGKPKDPKDKGGKGKKGAAESDGAAEMEAMFESIFDHPYKDKPRTKGKKNSEDSIFDSLYDEMSFKDSSNDGVDGSMMDAPMPGFNDSESSEIGDEMERISDRLTFIITMSKLWKFVTERVVRGAEAESNTDVAAKQEAFAAWYKHIARFDAGLNELLQRVMEYQVPPPRGTADSLLAYDRHRGTKEIIIDRAVWTQVEIRDAKMLLASYLGNTFWQGSENWEIAVMATLQNVFHNNVKNIKRLWKPMLRVLSQETILYVPTSRGGSAHAIVRCRCIQQAIIRLMEYAPRLGLLTEACQILGAVQTMEEMNMISPGAITEFDRLVETATRAIARCVAVSSRTWKQRAAGVEADSLLEIQDAALVDMMEQVVELLLSRWLSHSKQIRISPVESLLEKSYWDEIKQFIQRYGHDIFTQQNMGFGNLRAMLHQGVGNYLRSLLKIRKDDGEVELANTLLEDLEHKKIDFDSAVAKLEIILEAVAENYSEYVDYNSTTTHSDHGEKLYMLLDLLRVQVGYERISWNLKPVYWVHDALIRNGCDGAAVLWEQAVAKRSVDAAEEHLRHFNRLSEKYGMWLPSIYERLQERFVRPLQIDRMCGLVPKAARQVYEDGEKTAFAELSKQIENFAKTPLGVGFEMPEWLTALQDEVMMLRLDDIKDNKGSSNNNEENDVFGTTPFFEQVCITKSQLDKMIQTLLREEV